MSSTFSTTTTADQNIALMHRLIFEVQEKANFDLIDQLWHPDFINHTGLPGLPNGKAGVLPLLTRLHAVFKDIKMEIIHCVAQGNVVATNKILRGRQVEEFMGQAASGKMVELPIMDFVTIEGGMVKEHWARTGQVMVIE